MKKNDFLRGIRIFCFFILGFSSLTPVFAQPAEPLFGRVSNKKGTINLRYGDEVIDAQDISLNTTLLLNGPSRLQDSLFGKPILITKNNNTLTPGDVFTWWGSIEGDPNGYVVFAESNNIFSGNILWQDTLYQIRYVGNEVYQARKIDQNQLLRNEPVGDIQGTLILPNKAESNCSNTDKPWIIDVMVVYSNNVLSSAGDKNIIESEIYLAVSETNLAYLKSGIDQRIAIVFVGSVNYNESGRVRDDLKWLRDTSNVPSIRNTHAADLVVMFTETLDYNGKAYKMNRSPHDSSFEQYAYCVVRRKNATADYTFAHELGHLMGANHDCAEVPGAISSEYSHGHQFVAGDGKTYGTIMNVTGKFSRIPYFSNPSITYLSVPLGTNSGTCKADNHSVLNASAITVANFRCHSSNTANVWMKDTWNDTGAEPDPLTSSESMWDSPNIWVRNKKDTALIFNHMHQNPVHGTDNWIYVKLHNGGPTTSGMLKLYYTEASLANTWLSTPWNLLDSIPVLMNGSTSKTIEYKWSVPASVVDYTIVARWESISDPMASTEGESIDLNVRNNNNIAMKNLKLIDLMNRAGNSAIMQFMSKKETSLELNFDDTFPNKSFVETGSVWICFDHKTIRAIGGPPKGTGFTRIHRNLFLVTSSSVKFENLGADKGHIGKMKLHFRKSKNTPRQKYYCSVKQIIADEKSKTKSNPIAGISYQINLGY